MRLRSVVCFCLAITALPAAAHAERRCGWYANPTPGNLVLTDRDGDWWIQMQGRPDPDGIDKVPALTSDNSWRPMHLVQVMATDVHA